jgi:hypothetical protein
MSLGELRRTYPDLCNDLIKIGRAMQRYHDQQAKQKGNRALRIKLEPLDPDDIVAKLRL